MPEPSDRQAAADPAANGAGGTAARDWSSGELVLGVAAVARRLGVAPATLRTWDRRYGLGPTGHTPGAHRRYTPPDIARLEAMQRALLRGAAPAEAARYALAARPPPEQAPPEQAQREQAELGEPRGLTGPAELAELAESRELVMRPVRIGGRSLRLSGAGAPAHGLARAAASLDACAVRRLLDESLATQGVIATWDLVVRPVLGAIAGCWECTGAGVEVEHLLSEGAVDAFRNARPAPPWPGVPRPVLLACVPDELHSLPLYPLCAALAARGIRCRLLGAALPAAALTAAVRRTAPSAVFLWAQMPGYAEPGLLAGLPRIRPRVRVFAGGPGWSGVAVAAGVELVESLATATARIAAAVSTGSRRSGAMNDQ